MTRPVTTPEGANSEEPTDERVGTVLDGKWTLERVLGAGGMGAVYAARHRNGARAAVKVLHPELARRQEVRERFLREGYAANRVEHPGAVRVLDDDVVKEGPEAGTAYLVMEILEGESLEARLERGPPLTERELLGILDDVLAVLEAAHGHGVVHRDLKPANLFLGKDAAAGIKVLDFGLARLADAQSLTVAGLALGTPSFMAPEQASGRSGEIDARTDLFAIGATAFSILAGRDVHEAEGVLELVTRMGTVPAPKLRDVAPQASEALSRIVDRALEFQREDRYSSAAAMRADVRRALSALDAPSVPVASDAPEANDSASQRARKPRRTWPLLVVLSFVGAGAVALALAARDHRNDRNGSAPVSSSPIVSPPATTGAGIAPPPVTSDDPASDAAAGDGAVAAVPPDGSAFDGGEVADAAPASAEDDDDDEDPDASDVAAIMAHHGGAASVRPAPRPPPFRKHGPLKRRPRRPRHGTR